MNIRNLLIILFVSAFAIAGCSAPAASPTTQPTVNSVEPTQPPVQPEPTSVPVESEAPALAGNQTRYQIVPSESEVSYEVGETFINDDNRFAVAVGVTTQIEGEIIIDHENPQNSTIGPITVDISKFTSDSSRRDNYIRNNSLESASYPLAVFTPTAIEGLPATGVEGESYELQITGDLKVKEMVRQTTFVVTVSLSGDVLTGSAETTILMSDFGVGPISIAGILNTEDEVKLIFNFIARS